MTDLPPQADIRESRYRPLGHGAWRLRLADVRAQAPQDRIGVLPVEP